MGDYKLKGQQTILKAVLICTFILSVACGSEVGAGPKAPGFSLLDLSGNTVTLEQFRGKVVVLDFWATWCPPCRASIPDLVKMQKEYKNKGLVIVGISMDSKKKATDKQLKDFCNKYQVNYTIVRANRKVTEGYFGRGGISLPTMFIIDRKGVVQDKLVGYQHEALEKAIKGLF